MGNSQSAFRWVALAIPLIAARLTTDRPPYDDITSAFFGQLMAVYSIVLYSVRHWAYALSFVLIRACAIALPRRVPQLLLAVILEPFASGALVYSQLRDSSSAAADTDGGGGGGLSPWCPSVPAVGDGGDDAGGALVSRIYALAMCACSPAWEMVQRWISEGAPSAAGFVHTSLATLVSMYAGGATSAAAGTGGEGSGDSAEDALTAHNTSGSTPPPALLVNFIAWLPLVLVSFALRVAVLTLVRRLTPRPANPDPMAHLGARRVNRAKELGYVFRPVRESSTSTSTSTSSSSPSSSPNYNSSSSKSQKWYSLDLTLLGDVHWPWAAIFHAPLLALALLAGSADYDKWKEAGFGVPTSCKAQVVWGNVVAYLALTADAYARRERFLAYPIKKKEA